MKLQTTAAVISALAMASGAACVQAQERPPAARPAPPPARATGPALKPCQSTTVDAPTYLTLGKSQVIHLDFPAARMVVGGTGSSSVGRPTPVEAPPPPALAAGRAQ